MVFRTVRKLSKRNSQCAAFLESTFSCCWQSLQPAFGQPSAIGVAGRAPHPHAALLFADFVLSKEGQEIIKSRNRVPISSAVDSPLKKLNYELVDPVIVLDEWDKWSKLWSQLFLGGKEVTKEH